jgi:hypothetical protein
MSAKLTKKDLEAKIAELEEKLAKLSSQIEAKSAPQTPPPQAQAPPPPKPQTPPPQAQAPPPKPQAPPPAPKPQPEAQQLAVSELWKTAPMSDFHTYRTKVTGYSPSPNRYYAAKRIGFAKVDVPTSDWNLQKTKVTGYTQPSNKYFATREKAAYHPRSKYFAGFGLKGGSEQLTTAAPPPKLEKKPSRGSLPKGF